MPSYDSSSANRKNEAVKVAFLVKHGGAIPHRHRFVHLQRSFRIFRIFRIFPIHCQ